MNPAQERMRILVKGDTKEYRRVSTLKQAFPRMPHCLEVLEKLLIVEPNKLQVRTWPLLLQGLDPLIVAPRGQGKSMSLIPIIAHIAQDTRVIVASTRERSWQIFKALVNVTAACKPVVTDAVWDGIKANVLCRSFTSFPRVAMGGIGLCAQLGDTVRIVASARCQRVLATARKLTESTVELSRCIEFPLVVWMAEKSDTIERPCRTHVGVCSFEVRYGRYLARSLTMEHIVLIIAKNRAAANDLKDRLCEHGM